MDTLVDGCGRLHLRVDEYSYFQFTELILAPSRGPDQKPGVNEEREVAPATQPSRAHDDGVCKPYSPRRVHGVTKEYTGQAPVTQRNRATTLVPQCIQEPEKVVGRSQKVSMAEGIDLEAHDKAARSQKASLMSDRNTTGNRSSAAPSFDFGKMMSSPRARAHPSESNTTGNRSSVASGGRAMEEDIASSYRTSHIGRGRASTGLLENRQVCCCGHDRNALLCPTP